MGLRQGSAARELRLDAGWRLSLYPTAGEAGGSFRYSWQAPRQAPSGPGDPERSRLEAGRRARTALRRYCAANGLNRLGTLTYAGEGCHDERLLRTHVGGFMRSLRSGLGGRAFPYAWVPEWHKSGHGQHVHFAVGRYIDQRLIHEAWGRGYVWISPPPPHLRAMGSRVEARMAARYLSKYIGKDLLEPRSSGLHRYEVGQGFQPQPVKVEGRTVEEALDAASVIMGSLPDTVWHSDSKDSWEGPPAVWASWDR